MRGPLDEFLPLDLDDAELPVEVEAADDAQGAPLFDELPADDGAA